MAASASDPENRLTKVEFYNGATLLATATTAPYSFSWSLVPAGTYTLIAKAYDADGGSASSAAVTVTVAANQPPTVSLTAPANGATYIAPATVNMTANASDPENRLSKVEFYNGSTLLNTATTAPFGFTWASVPAGTYTLSAKAYDLDGGSTLSATVTVTVATNQPPTVSLTTPVNGATFTAPAAVSITANASDPENRLSKVEFYNGAALLGISTTSPYSCTWSSVAAGTYTLSAKA